MARTQHRVSILERACAVWMIALLLTASVISLAEALKAGNAVQLVVSLGLLCALVALLGLTISYRNVTEQQLGDFSGRPLELPGHPPIAPDAQDWIICAHISIAFGRQRTKVVAVDCAERRIHFKDCFMPQRFWGGWAFLPYASCSLDDVLSVPYMGNVDGPGGDLHIITTRGKAILPDDSSHYAQLETLLKEVARHTPAAPIVDSPRLYYWIIAGTVTGILGIGLVPLDDKHDDVLLLATGGGLGGLAALCLAWLCGKLRRRV